MIGDIHVYDLYTSGVSDVRFIVLYVARNPLCCELPSAMKPIVILLTCDRMRGGMSVPQNLCRRNNSK